MDVWLPDFKFGPGRCAITLARTLSSSYVGSWLGTVLTAPDKLRPFYPQ